MSQLITYLQTISPTSIIVVLVAATYLLPLFVQRMVLAFKGQALPAMPAVGADIAAILQAIKAAQTQQGQVVQVVQEHQVRLEKLEQAKTVEGKP